MEEHVYGQRYFLCKHQSEAGKLSSNPFFEDKSLGDATLQEDFPNLVLMASDNYDFVYNHRRHNTRRLRVRSPMDVYARKQKEHLLALLEGVDVGENSDVVEWIWEKHYWFLDQV